MIGSSASSSGERQSCDLTMMSSRSSPSKYSPAHRPPVIARIAAATSVRVSPERATRHSSGTSCSSGWFISSPGKACGYVPGIAFGISSTATRAACISATRSAPWKSMRISRALSPSTLSSEPRCTYTGVSGKPTMISSRSRRTISWMSRGSSG